MLTPYAIHRISAEVLRETILGKATWSRCPMCEGTGVENYDEDGEDPKPGYPMSQDRQVETCEECEGLGFNHREF